MSLSLHGELQKWRGAHVASSKNALSASIALIWVSKQDWNREWTQAQLAKHPDGATRREIGYPDASDLRSLERSGLARREGKTTRPIWFPVTP